MIKKIKYNSVNEFIKAHKFQFDDIKQIFDDFSKTNILIVGDFILDVYTKCRALGKTSKTPTISVKKEGSEYYLGGAGLFGNILGKTGCKVNLISLFGNEKNFKKIIQQKKPKKLIIKKVFEKGKPTTSKERFWVDGYKLLQVDVIDNKFISKKTVNKIISIYKKNLKSVKTIILSDSSHGLMSPDLVKKLIKLAKKNKKLLIIDCQINSSSGTLKNYSSIDIVFANEHEARSYLDDYQTDLNKLARKLFNKLKVKKYLLIKLGANGLILLGKNLFIKFPALKDIHVVDPIGSGDTLLSYFTLCLNLKIPLEKSLFISILAAGYSTTYLGTEAVDPKKIINFAKKII